MIYSVLFVFSVLLQISNICRVWCPLYPVFICLLFTFHPDIELQALTTPLLWCHHNLCRSITYSIHAIKNISYVFCTSHHILRTLKHIHFQTFHFWWNVMDLIFCFGFFVWYNECSCSLVLFHNSNVCHPLLLGKIFLLIISEFNQLLVDYCGEIGLLPARTHIRRRKILTLTPLPRNETWFGSEEVCNQREIAYTV